ncbi:hypothetical protein PMAYCL1PPCAC_32738, partial [Pristionchus mayeri]
GSGGFSSRPAGVSTAAAAKMNDDITSNDDQWLETKPKVNRASILTATNATATNSTHHQNHTPPADEASSSSSSANVQSMTSSSSVGGAVNSPSTPCANQPMEQNPHGAPNQATGMLPVQQPQLHTVPPSAVVYNWQQQQQPVHSAPPMLSEQQLYQW